MIMILSNLCSVRLNFWKLPGRHCPRRPPQLPSQGNILQKKHPPAAACVRVPLNFELLMDKSMVDEHGCTASVQAAESPTLEYSHFISLPLALHPDLAVQVTKFKDSVMALFPAKDKVDFAESGHGIEESIFIKPATLHLTVLMLKLWSKERVAAAVEVLQGLNSKLLEALDHRPVAVQLNGVECMKGSPAKAHILYARVEDTDKENRLSCACNVIKDAFVEAGLVSEKDKKQELKLHATLMNTSYRKRKRGKRFGKRMPFDARPILSVHGSEEWGAYTITEAHLSKRFVYDEDGYYHCCGSVKFPPLASST